MVSSFAAIRSSVHRAMEERVSSERGGEEEVVFTTHAIQAWIPSLTSTPGIAETKQWSMSIYRRATFAPSKGGKRVNVCRKSDAFLVFIFSCVHWLADVDRSWKNWWIGVGTIYFRTKKKSCWEECEIWGWLKISRDSSHWSVSVLPWKFKIGKYFWNLIIMIYVASRNIFNYLVLL